jgi:hypothetical protein
MHRATTGRRSEPRPTSRAASGRSRASTPRSGAPSRLSTTRDELEDWDLPFAYEALARAHAVAGDEDEAARFEARAGELAAQIGDPEDREQLEQDLATL